MNRAALTDVCAALRAVLGAAAVSVANVGPAGLEYVAADGAGASEIVGTTLTGGRGLASFVAATGQSLVIGRVDTDPRFARDVAEHTGYVPTAMLLVPILATDGEVGGVLSVLDRSATTLGDEDALAVAGRFADIAAHLLVPELQPDDVVLARRIAALDDVARRAIRSILEAFGA